MYAKQLVIIFVAISCVRSQLGFDLLETAKNPFQYLEEQSYTYENHTVITQDGYELLLVRIPNDRNETPSNISKPPILFVHGLLATMADFLVPGPGVSFAFKALEEGYDVFLLNTRGSRWSRRHATLNPDTDDEYWDFSFHDLGQNDLPAAIDSIINITGHSQVSYVGHSQGTTAFLAMASTKPEYNHKIKLSVLLAPVAYISNAQFSLIVLLKNEVNFVEDFFEAIDVNEFLPYNPTISAAGKYLCSPDSPLTLTCKTLIYDIGGPSSQFNASLFSAYKANFPAGASRKALAHYLQNANSGFFRKFDYGVAENLIQYGRVTPPNYDLSEVTAPIALYYGADDNFAAVVDVAKLAVRLPNVVRNVLIPYAGTNHFDLLMGTHTFNLFQYLQENQYLYEYNSITTEDSYKLLLIRLLGSKENILRNTTKPPILFVHENFGNFFNYLFGGLGLAFGNIALDQAYVVFLVNTKRNILSRSHVFLDPESIPIIII